MLTVVRIITSIFLFIFIFLFLYFGILIVGGAIVGGIAGAQNPDNAAQAGEQAGIAFAQNNIVLVTISSLILSGISSLALSFGGILPWCKKKKPEVTE